MEHLPESPAKLTAPDRLYDGYIFDLDGTLLLGDSLLPGAKRLVEGLLALGRRVIYVTNNPTKRPADVVARLIRDGLPATPETVVNTITTTINWISTFEPDAVVFPIAEPPVIDALREANIRMSEVPEEIDLILASYDRTFAYRKLQIAFDTIHLYGRARLIATNPDRYCPMPEGRGEPDTAAIIGAIEGCTGIQCERHFGKPDVFMLETAMQRLGLRAEDCLMVGDRLTTDIRMAIDAGMPSALPLTGETTMAMLESIGAGQRPNFVVERIDQLIPENIWKDRLERGSGT